MKALLVYGLENFIGKVFSAAILIHFIWEMKFFFLFCSRFSLKTSNCPCNSELSYSISMKSTMTSKKDNRFEKEAFQRPKASFKKAFGNVREKRRFVCLFFAGNNLLEK